MRRSVFVCPFLVVLASLAILACDPSTPPGPTQDSGPIDAGPEDSGVVRTDSGPPDSGMDAGGSCEGVICTPGAHCEGGDCFPNECSDLTCNDEEVCRPSPDGIGHVCADNTCADDVDCAEPYFCDGSICVEDICEPGARRCSAEGDVEECEPNGSAWILRYDCGSDVSASACTEVGGSFFCSCHDDWDCPTFTECEIDRCVGTGEIPSCLLAPAVFTDVLPMPEPGFPWGGSSIVSPNAVGSPFPDSAQSIVAPVVINLDDDNGDGLINERDVPEIVFMTFCGSDFLQNGVLRAVHGGGPSRGQDYFATCGDRTWHEGEALDSVACDCATDPDLHPTSNLAAGDLDGDGVPEIVALTERNKLRIFNHRGEPLLLWPGPHLGTNASLSIANIDGTGFAEIISGNKVIALERDASGDFQVQGYFVGTLGEGIQVQGPISCVADLNEDGRMEIIAGSSVYNMPRPPPGVTRVSECPPVSTLTDPEEIAFCRNELVVAWDGRNVNGALARREGFCAVADVWGADPGQRPSAANPLDGVPEVVLIAAGRLQIFNGLDGTLIHDNPASLSGGGDRGGAPNVDDFDGDGFPEVATAFAGEYVVIDLQPPTAACPRWLNVFEDGVPGLQGNTARTPPAAACTRDEDCGDPDQFACNESIGQCVCMHNGWARRTEDDSSRVTGSSVFDFNGDGASEVVYNDECYFRIYNGLDGEVFFKEHSPSRTRTEYPVVADVDNDGNAEIVFSASNESGFCSEGNDYNNGIEVWGDSSDLWVSARRIWNQHSYHVTNVQEGGGIPVNEPPSWQSWNGRLYNTYRSQPRSQFGIAPDLLIGGLQLSSPEAVCGTLLDRVDIAVRVVNAGDLRVGAGVTLAFFGEWDSPVLEEPLYATGGSTPLTWTLTDSLEPGSEILITVPYDANDNAPMTLPDRVRAVIDADGAERECHEDNNGITVTVEPGELVPDLSVELLSFSADCPEVSIETRVTNSGSAPASAILVRYYAGDPTRGGISIHEETVAGPIPQGESTTFTALIPAFPLRLVTVHATVDPDDAIEECNDGNNRNRSDPIDCEIVL